MRRALVAAGALAVGVALTAVGAGGSLPLVGIGGLTLVVGALLIAPLAVPAFTRASGVVLARLRGVSYSFFSSEKMALLHSLT